MKLCYMKYKLNAREHNTCAKNVPAPTVWKHLRMSLTSLSVTSQELAKNKSHDDHSPGAKDQDGLKGRLLGHQLAPLTLAARAQRCTEGPQQQQPEPWLWSRVPGPGCTSPSVSAWGPCTCCPRTSDAPEGRVSHLRACPQCDPSLLCSVSCGPAGLAAAARLCSPA